ncbi:MAG TPA: hypothetical protein VNN09_11725 [Candidatus Competibacteraceae bacterium]|nr:hypothetical protein [Candidatus Competibacteraceae bacterium]
MRRCLCLALCLLATAAAGAQQSDGPPIYHWLEQDVEHYGQVPPPDPSAARLYRPRPQNPGVAPRDELQRRVQSYNEQIELLRDVRAARLGVDRRLLERLEAEQRENRPHQSTE